MALINHDISTPNDGLGDELRTAFDHQNQMNSELYDTKVDKITGKGLSANDFTNTLLTKLNGIQAGAEVNVQPDWNQTDDTQDDYIKNKPAQLLNSAGYYSYLNTLSAQTIVSNVELKLLNNGAGVTENPPYGVISLWNNTTNQFDFNDLTIGDLVTLSVDFETTNDVKLTLKLGDGNELEVSKTTSFAIENTDIKTLPSELYVLSASGGTISVVSFYVQVLRKGLNLVDITNDAAALISTDASNSIELGTDGKLFSSGGGGGVGTLQEVTDLGNITTNAITVQGITISGSGNVTNVGPSAGASNIGETVLNIGLAAGDINSGDYVTNIGTQAGQNNVGNNVTNLGQQSGNNNTGNNVINIGEFAGISNTLDNVINLGINSQATATNQLAINTNVANTAINLPTTATELTLRASASVETIAYLSDISGGGGTLTREEFTFVASQDFTLSYTPSGIYAVFVNGQELNSSQYSTATNVLTIIDTLESGDKINIIYSASSIGVLDYYTKAEIDAFNYEPNHAEFIEVNSLADLPTQISGVITLVGGYTYLFLKHIDLLGSRLVCGQDTVIVGWSSENCSITSTGLSSSTALITSTYSLPIRNISFTHDIVFDLQGDGTTTALDWFGVNLLNCASGGIIKDYTNFVAGDSALLNSGGFTFDGTIGTIAFSNCLFDCASTKTAINVLSTCTISRRLRIIYSSFVVLSGETGVNFNSSATVGDEKYILDTVNFSGGGTYITGVDSTSNKALFANCVGITNTSTRGFMYMINNATDTTIGVGNVNVWVKASGVTTLGANSKFTSPTSNRLTYTGAFSGSFLVTLNATARSSASNQSVSIGVAKNGVIISESEGIIRTTTANVEHGGSTQAVVELTTNDYIELYVRNTNSTDIRITDFNFNVIKIPV